MPEELKPPPEQMLLFHLHAKGSQIYTCMNKGGAYAWTLKGPSAQLFDAAGKQAARHFAGPTWEANDGSRVVGKLAASVPSPDPGSIPWLLLYATANGGSGSFSKVKTVQRVNTTGGKAPESGCDDSRQNAETSVPYEADYYFYGNAR